MKDFLARAVTAALAISLPACLEATPTPSDFASSASSHGRVLRQAAQTPSRVRLYSAKARDLAEPDYSTWKVTDGPSSNTTIGPLSLSLSPSDGATLTGGEYKLTYRRFVASLGERVVGQGVTTNEDDGSGSSITLSISGLEAGEHSLLAWHNTWHNLQSLSSLDVAIDGTTVATDVAQSIRIDNIWETASSYVKFEVDGPSQEVQVTYKPTAGDGLVYINGFEIDTPHLGQQIAFPTPHHRDERIQLRGGDSTTASWNAPSDLEGVTYDVYLGTTADDLTVVTRGLTETSVELTGLNTFDTYYWRVDVVANGTTYVGRTFLFRAAQLAFPGAEGYGRFARGGRGGKVVKVTSLEDTTEPGTLRYALTVATGPRIIIFDVGGVITTKSRMSVNSQYITIAGQTAPGKGIVVQGMPLGLSGASDVIVRHMRVRPGRVSGQTIDGMGMQGSNHCIFDRCSIGWTIDEAFSSRSAYNITLQRTMISEPLNIAGHKNYPDGTKHGFAATVGGDVGSFHHNLIAHAEGRSWSMGGGLDNAGFFAGRLDLRNNVVYNWGGRVTDGGAKEVNFVGNYYQPGPQSRPTYALRAQYEDGLPGTQQYHCAGNSMPGHFDQDSVQYPDGDGTGITENIACFADVTIDPAPTYQKFFPEPFFEPYVETHISTEAYKLVLSDSGASQPVRDDHDRRIVRETLTNTTTYVGSVSGEKGLIDHEEDVGGLEDFPAVVRPASWDADGDGIADWWDGSTGGEGYTPIEGYLNFMADPHAFVSPSGTVEIDVAAELAAGFAKEPAFAVSGATKGKVTFSGSVATYVAGAEAGIDRFEVEISDAEGSSYTRSFGVAIFEGAEDVQ
ncbi:hypothetical protein DL767_000988 [Monosporascus sp. MG133]|nr:hypothetical protein DL767_000988 [Monosporascus sp. MG133]